MRGSTILDIPRQEQEWRRAELRHARRGCVLTLHVLLLGAAGRTPTAIAPFLFCSRTSGYRSVTAYHPQWRDARFDQPLPAVGGLTPSVRRSLLALLKRVPAVYGWCRTRWSCATLAAPLQLQRGSVVSTSTLRRWLHGLGWVWNRTQVVAGDDDPQRVEKLPVSATRCKPWGTGRLCCLPMNSTFTCCPRSVIKGGPRARRSSA